MEINNNEKNLQLAADIVSAYVGNNPVPMAELSSLIESVHLALQGLRPEAGDLTEKPVPAVPIKKSVTPEYLICLEDGKKFRSLKRTLKQRYGMTPEQYRTKWGLPADYPMTAPAYSARRSELAKSLGLGTKAARKTPSKQRRQAK